MTSNNARSCAEREETQDGGERDVPTARMIDDITDIKIDENGRNIFRSRGAKTTAFLSSCFSVSFFRIFAAAKPLFSIFNSSSRRRRRRQKLCLSSALALSSLLCRLPFDAKYLEMLFNKFDGNCVCAYLPRWNGISARGGGSRQTLLIKVH